MKLLEKEGWAHGINWSLFSALCIVMSWFSLTFTSFLPSQMMSMPPSNTRVHCLHPSVLVLSCSPFCNLQNILKTIH